MDIVGAARADLKPKLGAGASYQYVGHQMELNINLEALGSPVSFQGQNDQYNAFLSLSQPVYQGGRLLAILKRAEGQRDVAQYQSQMLTSVVSQQSDVTYWNCVAMGEVAAVALESKESIEEFVKVVKQRVDLGYADPTDLLMVEVKLNESEYMLMQANTSYAISKMALNSITGVNLNVDTTTDSVVAPINTTDWIGGLISNPRPEVMIARTQIGITKADKKIVNSKYLPQINIGAEGNYKSPAYDFSSDMKPNYGIYAKVSVPVFEWGKRTKESRAAGRKINIATQNLEKTEDQVALETESSRKTLEQSVEQVNLTYRSLAKALENEQRSLERYREGKMSVLDILQAQLYRQNAQVNYIQAKVVAQNSWSELQRSLNLYNQN